MLHYIFVCVQKRKVIFVAPFGVVQPKMLSRKTVLETELLHHFLINLFPKKKSECISCKMSIQFAELGNLNIK